MNYIPKLSFVTLGAQKSGTTTLHFALAEHPKIFMSNPLKEPSFFRNLDEVRFFLRRSSYSDQTNEIVDRDDLMRKLMMQGFNGEKSFGESTTNYTFGWGARKGNIANNMYDYNPNLRFIYLVRNPFERLISGYRHASRHGDRGTFEQWLSTQEGQASIKTSSYAYQIEAYLTKFSLDKFLIMKFEDLVSNQASQVKAAHFHLGLEPIEPSAFVHRNQTPEVKFAQGETEATMEVFQPAYEEIIADLERFVSITGLDISSWDLELPSWCLC